MVSHFLVDFGVLGRLCSSRKCHPRCPAGGSDRLTIVIPIAELVGPEVVEDVATPANVRLGKALAADSAVELAATDSDRVDGWVGGGDSATQRRRVALWSDQQVLAWSCTCTNEPNLFCKHLVAAAITLRGNATK